MAGDGQSTDDLGSPRQRLEEVQKQARIARDYLRDMDSHTGYEQRAAEHADQAVIAAGDALDELDDSVGEDDEGDEQRLVPDGSGVTQALLAELDARGGEATAGDLLNAAVEKQAVDVHRATQALQRIQEAGDVYMPEPDRPLLKRTTADAAVAPDGGDD